jgi:heat shock protein HslJ
MKKISFVLITLLMLLTACSSGNSLSIEGEWTLVSYGDAANTTPALPNVEASLNFEANGQFGGNVGCNGFGGGYTVSGDQITFESIVSTMMFCEGISDQETAVLGILSDQTLTATITGNQLTLTSTDGSSVIVLERK